MTHRQGTSRNRRYTGRLNAPTGLRKRVERKERRCATALTAPKHVLNDWRSMVLQDTEQHNGLVPETKNRDWRLNSSLWWTLDRLIETHLQHTIERYRQRPRIDADQDRLTGFVRWRVRCAESCDGDWRCLGEVSAAAIQLAAAAVDASCLESFSSLLPPVLSEVLLPAQSAGMVRAHAFLRAA